MAVAAAAGNLFSKNLPLSIRATQASGGDCVSGFMNRAVRMAHAPCGLRADTPKVDFTHRAARVHAAQWRERRSCNKSHSENLSLPVLHWHPAEMCHLLLYCHQQPACTNTEIPLSCAAGLSFLLLFHPLRPLPGNINTLVHCWWLNSKCQDELILCYACCRKYALLSFSK